MPYDGDSFFTLSMAGRVGLLLLSTALSVLFILLGHRVARGWPVAVRPILALLLFWLFVWLSPQIYYQYYHLLFENLPHQWVVQWPPTSPFPYLSFTHQWSLSAHGQGVLGWAMIIAAILQRRGQRD